MSELMVAWEAQMSQKDLFDKAAECARMIGTTNDPLRRDMLTHLQTLWTNLANESLILGEAALAEQIATVTTIHADLIPAPAEGDSSSTNQVIPDSTLRVQ